MLAGVLLLGGILAGCAGRPAAPTTAQPTVAQPAAPEALSPEQMKGWMDEGRTYTLVDVRTQEEYDQGYIPGAVLIPDSELIARAPEKLPDQTATIVVYCRSGRRSAAAAQALVEAGYTNVYDLGGIINWPYEITTP
ncbi:MAG: rhodanese-like domain-containing protein [Eubacteriales bacterium]|nr:rhodanese-like domain-containing protein [Eubacteriales bacterium]